MSVRVDLQNDRNDYKNLSEPVRLSLIKVN